MDGLYQTVFYCVELQESLATARKTHDAARVRCGLKFADIHYKLGQAPKARLQSYGHNGEK